MSPFSQLLKRIQVASSTGPSGFACSAVAVSILRQPPPRIKSRLISALCPPLRDERRDVGLATVITQTRLRVNRPSAGFSEICFRFGETESNAKSPNPSISTVCATPSRASLLDESYAREGTSGCKSLFGKDLQIYETSVL